MFQIKLKLDNIEIVTISKGPAKIMENKMKRISENFALTLTNNFEIFQLALNFYLVHVIQSHYSLHVGTFVQSE